MAAISRFSLYKSVLSLTYISPSFSSLHLITLHHQVVQALTTRSKIDVKIMTSAYSERTMEGVDGSTTVLTGLNSMSLPDTLALAVQELGFIPRKDE